MPQPTIICQFFSPLACAEAGSTWWPVNEMCYVTAAASDFAGAPDVCTAIYHGQVASIESEAENTAVSGTCIYLRM